MGGLGCGVASPVDAGAAHDEGGSRVSSGVAPDSTPVAGEEGHAVNDEGVKGAGAVGVEEVRPVESEASAPGEAKPSNAMTASKEDRKRFLAALDAGRIASKRGAYAEAIVKLREALEVNPTNAAALGELGWAALKAGDLTLAESATASALRYSNIDTQRGSLLYNLGRVAEARDAKDVAIAYYRRSLELRDNDTVRGRIEALGGNDAPSMGLGLARVGGTFETLDAACRALSTAKCPTVPGESNTTVCSCAPTLEATQLGGEVGLLVFSMSDGPEERSWHPVFKTASGWVLFDAVEWEYNPGAFGVFEEVERVSGEDLGAFDDGAAKQHFFRFSFSKSRRDSDMGICELELEAHSLAVVCGSRGDEVACMAPVLDSYTLTRALEPNICDEETLRELAEPPSQTTISYTAKTSWTMTPVPALVVENVSTIGEPTLGAAYRPMMLPSGTYPFEQPTR